MIEKVKLAWHVLIGKPLIYKAHIIAPLKLGQDTKGLIISDCQFDRKS